MARTSSRSIQRSQSVMSPEHPQWRQFLSLLRGKNGLARWGCQHDHRISRRILEAMGGIDVAASLAFFEEHGGYSDCEVAMNVTG